MIFHIRDGLEGNQRAHHRDDQEHNQGKIVAIKNRCRRFPFNQEEIDKDNKQELGQGKYFYQQTVMFKPEIEENQREYNVGNL